MWKCVKVKTQSGPIGKLRDGSRKTSSLIRSEQITLTKNPQRSKEKKPKNV